MSGAGPTLTVNTGVQLPTLGFGFYQSAPEETNDAVMTALESGYRLIDTGAAYFNEREVGAAIGRAGVYRSELFRGLAVHAGICAGGRRQRRSLPRSEKSISRR